MKVKDFINYDFENETIIKTIDNEPRHFHKLNKEKTLLSISRILKEFINWKYQKIPKEHLFGSKITGKLSHKLIENYFKNKNEYQLNNENLTLFLGENLEQFNKFNKEKKTELINKINFIVIKIINFLNENNFEVLAVEKYVCDFNFHGIIDLICLNSKNEICIIDLKTSSIEETKIETTMQLSLYLDLVKNYLKNEKILLYELNFNTKTNELKLNNIDYSEDWQKLKELIMKLIKIN